MDRLRAAVSVPSRHPGAGALSSRRFLGGSGGCDRRMRKRSSAHPAETILRAVIVSAMRAADIHGFKHSSIFGWQKGCCCWKLELTRPKSLPETLNEYRACLATSG